MKLSDTIFLNKKVNNNLKFLKQYCRVIKFKDTKLKLKKKLMSARLLKNLRILNIF